MKRAPFAMLRRVFAKVLGPGDEAGPQKLAAQGAASELERYRPRHRGNGSAAGSAAGHGQRSRAVAEPSIGRPDPDRGLGDGGLIQASGVPAAAPDRKSTCL